MSDVQASLEEYRDVREALERAVLPLATSVDGRRFRFQTTLHELELEAGGYVTLDSEGSTRLGQVLSLELDSHDATGPGLPQVRIRIGLGEGVVLDGGERPFHDATVRPATPDEVDEWLESDPRARCSRSVSWRSHTAYTSGWMGAVRAPHIPVRPVGLRQDVLARRAPRAAPDGDQPASGGARSELGLRAAGGHAADADAAALARFAPLADSIAVRSGVGDRDAIEFASASSARRCRRRCCGSTRSRTARSTPS